jgi:rhamnulokinase
MRAVQRKPLRLLALDLGAESGRAMVGAFDGSRLQITETHRFANVPVRLGGTLYWDVLRLFGDIVDGIRGARAAGPLASLGVDAWGVDFGLLDARGRLLSNPVHYRDTRTEHMLERAFQRVPRATIYSATGIQFLPINTLYQLLAMAQAHDPDLERAERLLLIADLLHHFLCGSEVAEYTNATTTQCLDATSGKWAVDLLSRLEIPTRILPEVVPAGTLLGSLRADVAAEVGGDVRVVAPATHDTASAVAATPLPADGSTAFLSSGTWSLIGLELQQPVLSSAAREANLTNEGGVAGTIRLLKNVMGLWLVQEARRAFASGGSALSYEQLTALARSAPGCTAFVDPDDARFLRPGDLPTAVQAFCRETAQPPPADAGTLVRVVLESLALKYAVVLRQLEAASGRTISSIHIVGGGSNNALLCQLTANASGLPVMAGPSEATALGNLIVQGIALGELASLDEARALVAASFPAHSYEPLEDWSVPCQRFDELLSTRAQQGVLE